MRPLTRFAWYALLLLRYVVAFALGWLSVRLIGAREWPFWIKVIVEFLVVNGLIVGAFVVGPMTYRGYLEEQRRLFEAMTRVGTRTDRGNET